MELEMIFDFGLGKVTPIYDGPIIEKYERRGFGKFMMDNGALLHNFGWERNGETSISFDTWRFCGLWVDYKMYNSERLFISIRGENEEGVDEVKKVLSRLELS